MVDGLAGLIRGLAGWVNRGAAAFTKFLAVLVAATAADLLFGRTGLVAVVAALVVFAVVGYLNEVFERRRRRDEAYERRDSPEETLRPIEDCLVHPWLGQKADDDLPEFVERGEWELLCRGLKEKRFVLITGKEICGKSRLAYEACAQLSQVTLVARDPPRVGDDPLRLLMEDDNGFPAQEDSQILLIKEVARRLRSGCLDGALVREWLERNPRMSLVVVQTAMDEREIAEAGVELERVFEELVTQAQVVEVQKEFDGADRRTAKKIFPELDEQDLKTLPRYLALGPPLRGAIEDARRGRNAIGLAIVRVVADWHRAGVTIPVPLDFLEEHAHRLVDETTKAEFEKGLAWALGPVKGEAALIYEISGPSGPGYVPDSTLTEVFRNSVEERKVLPIIWHNARYKLKQMSASGERPEKEIAAQLTSLGEAAYREGEESAGKLAFDAASSLDPDLESGIGDFVVEETESTLVRSRRGDGVLQRLAPVEQLARGRGWRKGSRPNPLAESPSKALGWIYRRNWLRTTTRCALLAALDLASVGVGLLASFAIRSWITGTDVTAAAFRSSSFATVILTALVVLCVFAWAGLYEKDATRARIGAIATVLSVLSIFGWITLLATGENVFYASLGVFCGGAVCLGLDLGGRAVYDHFSRGWVTGNSIEARTLLIGSPGDVADLEKVLEDFSRPMKVIGYLKDGEDREGGPTGKPKTPCLGGVEELGDIAQRDFVGRVILADPTIDAERRQRLADRCHERHLLVEARASVIDVRSGLSRFVLGQPVLLVPLWPLWPRNLWAFAKRLMDIVLSLLILALFAIPMIIVAIVIKAQKGPVFVSTLRLGLGTENFHMLRFRTAKGDSGGIEILEPEDPSEPVERIWMGTVLERSGADELPQLWNVLRGQMSLVGPRPLELRHHIHFDEGQLQRYLVRPGATGPWQVSRQPLLTYDQLTALDIGYLRHWSIFTDIELLARTLLLMRTRRTVPKIVGRGDALGRDDTRAEGETS